MRRFALITTVSLCTIPALAAQQSAPTEGGNELPLIMFSSDEPLLLDHRLSESFAYGVRLEIETKREVNYDLDFGNDDNYYDIEPKLIGSAVYEPNDLLRAYAEITLSQKLILENPDSEDTNLKLEIKQAYITLRDIMDGVSLSAGREYTGDEREWLFDEELDGASLRLRNDFMGLEVAYRRDGIFQRDLLLSENTVHPDYYYALGYFAFDKDNQINPFVIYQDGHDGRTDEDLLFLGVQSVADFGDGLEGWADGAFVFGEARDGRDVQGFGFDVGVTKTIKTAPLRPYFTAAVALGSGDDGSGTDTAFRQTGLQGNSDRFGGVTSLNYYGEVLDPELSNLGILTLGVGVRPTPRSSIDLIYHRYLQPRLEDDFRDVSIVEEPDGENSHIGDELDLVFGFKEIERLDISLSAGVFLPGTAFENDDPAVFAKLEIDADL